MAFKRRRDTEREASKRSLLGRSDRDPFAHLSEERESAEEEEPWFLAADIREETDGFTVEAGISSNLDERDLAEPTAPEGSSEPAPPPLPAPAAGPAEIAPPHDAPVPLTADPVAAAPPAGAGDEFGPVPAPAGDARGEEALTGEGFPADLVFDAAQLLGSPPTGADAAGGQRPEPDPAEHAETGEHAEHVQTGEADPEPATGLPAGGEDPTGPPGAGLPADAPDGPRSNGFESLFPEIPDLEEDPEVAGPVDDDQRRQIASVFTDALRNQARPGGEGDAAGPAPATGSDTPAPPAAGLDASEPQRGRERQEQTPRRVEPRRPRPRPTRPGRRR